MRRLKTKKRKDGCVRLRLHSVALAAALLLCPTWLPAEVVSVRHSEGSVRGFLSLSSLDGERLAYGDLTQSVHGDRVTRRLVFRFKDGSVLDETVVYSQHGTFRLLTDHVIQKGPVFLHPMEVSIDGRSGLVTVRYKAEDGSEKVTTTRLSLPSDLANGLILTLMKNIGPETAQMTVSMVAATPKPLLVKLHVAFAGEEPFAISDSQRTAMHYVVKVEISGLTGVVAPLVGRQPADSHVWILGGEAPAFLKAEGPLSSGGPSWRIELLSPVWPAVVAPKRQ
jgi:hypothetical protein